MIAHVGRDLANHPAIHHAQRAHAHALIAHAHAAETQNAARRIEENHRRELLLRRMNFFFRVPALARAVTEHHVLQFALAALIAHRAIQRMVGQQELERILARLLTCSVSVRTTMPSDTGRVHAVIIFGIFSTSTRHMRQAAPA